MTAKKPPKPPPGFSAFKTLLTKIARVPKREIDEQETEYRREREATKRVKKAAREKSVENIEKHFVVEALKRNAWNVTKSAEETGMQRANFQALMKKYQIRLRGTEQDPDGADDS